MRRVPREAPGGVRERPPVLATAASKQAKHHPVYPGTRTVRGATRDRLGGAWRLTEDALLKSERLRFIYSRNEPHSLLVLLPGGVWLGTCGRHPARAGGARARQAGRAVT